MLGRCLLEAASHEIKATAAVEQVLAFPARGVRAGCPHAQRGGDDSNQLAKSDISKVT